jgi:hypothetical protein
MTITYHGPEPRDLTQHHLRVVVSDVVAGAPGGNSVTAFPVLGNLLGMQEETLGGWLRQLAIQLLNPSVVETATPIRSIRQQLAVQIYRSADGSLASHGAEPNFDWHEHVCALIPAGSLFGDWEAQLGLVFIDMLLTLEGVVYTTQ